MNAPPNTNPTPPLPLVVQVAFAGPRHLAPPPALAGSDSFPIALERCLKERLYWLPADLGLSERHEICGVSSLAIGGDLAFTRACQSLNWRQRVFLPQAREDFFAALGSRGPDFSPEQAQAARELLANPHVIEERVCSVSPDRHTRFEDVNLELVRVCDVFVCLVPAVAADGQPSITLKAQTLAQRWHRPVLELRFSTGADGQPLLSDQWHWPPAPQPAEAVPFTPPNLPAPLDRIPCVTCTLNEPAAYRHTLQQFSSREAKRLQNRFRWAALIIVGAHVLATALALLAIKTHGETALRWLLGVELSFLVSGLLYHEWLHHSHAVGEWALSRLCAEVVRSVDPLAGVPRPLSYLFELPMPGELRPLLSTLNVLHLADRRIAPATDWSTRRETYVNERLRKPKKGQLDYFTDKIAEANRWLSVAHRTFYIGSLGACLATACKLLLVLQWWHPGIALHDVFTSVFGVLAVLLPVVAVAALSLAAAFDLEARVHTYEEMLEFLHEQTRLLETAASENEFATLALQTESRLLGETANWHARRAFTGVA
jgi:hypothetical protein